jgi:hypothetical protein
MKLHSPLQSYVSVSMGKNRVRGSHEMDQKLVLKLLDSVKGPLEKFSIVAIVVAANPGERCVVAFVVLRLGLDAGGASV